VGDFVGGFIPVSLYKRGGKWWTEFSFQGKRIRQSTGTDKKAKAKEFESGLRERLHEQLLLGRQEEMTLGEASTYYLTTNIGTRRKTVDGKKRLSTKYDEARLKQFSAYFGEHEPLSKVVTPTRLAEYKTHLLKTMQPNSANRLLNSFRAVLTSAFKAGGLSRLPVVEGFSVNDARERYLSAAEETALIEACKPSPHLFALVVFCLDTGARRGEALSLSWDTVSLPADGGRARGSVRFTDTKTGKPRTVPLPTRTADLLLSIRPEKPKAGARVFVWCPPGEGKEAVPFSNPSKAWTAAKKKAKLENLRLHDLRHTYASKLIKKRVPLYEISKLLGHSDVRMTQRYAHLAQDDLDQAVSVLD
jgi:integrase